ncbi:hypothetical protein TWF696_003764 [Orbilia brochopaga]|uniref:Uncharacterized protein n=1 Tax=Orbilia brochopaga TaxID=3140254 RepID=A0AAV9V5S4_9PEZI
MSRSWWRRRNRGYYSPFQGSYYSQGGFYPSQGNYFSRKNYYSSQGGFYPQQGAYSYPQASYYARRGARANPFSGPWNPTNTQSFNHHYDDYRNQNGIPAGADGGFYFWPDQDQYHFYDPQNTFPGAGFGGDDPFDFDYSRQWQQPRTYSGQCQYNHGNGFCSEQIRNPFSQFCDFHTFASGAGSVPHGNEYGNYAQWAYNDPRGAAYHAAMNDAENFRRWKASQGGNSWFGGGPTQQQSAWIYMREIDSDNWPLFLKCVYCRRVYNDPVAFIHPTTRQQTACCHGCVTTALQNAGPMPGHPTLNRMFSRTPAMQRATRLNHLRVVFERNFAAMIMTEAPHQICHFCGNVMTNPVVTCHNVPAQYWVYSHGSVPPDPNRPVNHAFCKGCLENYRFADGADYAQCPFMDKMWSSLDRFRISMQYNREARGIAGRAWEQALRMA